MYPINDIVIQTCSFLNHINLLKLNKNFLYFNNEYNQFVRSLWNSKLGPKSELSVVPSFMTRPFISGLVLFSFNLNACFTYSALFVFMTPDFCPEHADVVMPKRLIITAKIRIFLFIFAPLDTATLLLLL